MIRYFMPAMLAALLGACAAAPPKDYQEERVLIGDAPLPYFLRKSSVYKHFVNGEYFYHWGLVAEDGRVLVPLEREWTGILVVNEHWAIGKSLNEPTYTIVRLPEGTLEPTPYVSYQWWTAYGSSVKHLNMHHHPRWETNRFDVTFMDAKGHPAREYQDLGGASVSNENWIGGRLFRSFGSRSLCLDTTMPDGSAVSRLLTLDGLPTGPILPRILTYFHLPAFREPPVSTSTYQMAPSYREWGFTIADLKDPGLPDSRLVHPLNAEGHPLPLPTGAAGVVSLTWGTSIWSENKEWIRIHSGWAIVYPTDKRVEYAVGLGTIDEVLAKADSLPRYEGLRKVRTYREFDEKLNRYEGTPVLAVKKVGQPSWELVVTDTFAPFLSAPAGETLPTFDALMAHWDRLKKEAHAKWVEAEKLRVAKEAEARRKERELLIATQRPHFEAVLSGRETPGYYRTLTIIAKELGRTGEYQAFVARKLREEAVQPTPHAQYWISESRELGSKAHEALVDKLENDAADSRLKDAERKRVEYDNWVKFARAAEEARISANAASPNPALSGYTETYKRNLEAWNKGQLNWFTPDPLKK